MTFFSSPALVQSFNIGPLDVIRSNPPAQNARGGFDPARTKTLKLNPIAVAPATGRVLDQVPEADRNTQLECFYTLVRLHVADDGRAADLICYQGRSFRVVDVRNLSLQGGVFIVVASLQEPGE